MKKFLHSLSHLFDLNSEFANITVNKRGDTVHQTMCNTCLKISREIVLSRNDKLVIMPIEDEISILVQFLSHPAGFNVDLAGVLCIRPVSEDSPPSLWEVDWTENPHAKVSNAFPYEYAKEFTSLKEAVRFFVEKRHDMRNGLDFEKEYWEKENE